MSDAITAARSEGGGETFDLKKHGEDAAIKYLRLQSFYGDLAEVVARILRESLKLHNIKTHSVQARAKDPTSFARKAATPSELDPNLPKYTDPITQITDLAGVRVITHFLGTLTEVDSLINDEFEIAEKSNKGLELIEEDRFGYQSIHYLVRIKNERIGLAEYERFADVIVELQVRTILQHAWAEIEHDIQYKSSDAIPTEIRRRFMALAGMLEIADREFQAISDADRELEQNAERNVQSGNLAAVEITPKALKSFLDKYLGSDGRMSQYSYEWATRLLKALGFRDLDEVRRAIAPYNDHELSVIAEGTRQGQISRFEIMLQAALGHLFLQRHPWRSLDWYPGRVEKVFERMKTAGVPIGTYKFPQTQDIPARGE
jgi:ppGpp synthetase/RelA/SpoT-type nucleotidyltranferase